MAGIYRQTGQHGNYDQTVPVWKGGIAVSPSDLIFRDADGYDKPASLYPWTTDQATTLAAFHDVFRGVSTTRRTAAQTTDGGRTDGCPLTTGEFEYPCAALGAAAAVGALVTVAKQTGNFLESQKVAITTVLAEAIGILSEDSILGSTTLKFKIHPALANRGVQPIQ